MMDLNTLQKKIKKLFPEYKITKQFGELTISLPSDHAIKALKKLKANRELGFDQLIDLAAVDYSEFKQSHQISIQIADLSMLDISPVSMLGQIWQWSTVVFTLALGATYGLQ